MPPATALPEKKRPARRTAAPLPEAAFEQTLVEVFSELADLFGNPRSHGQIYGILFASPEPLTMDAIAARLRISKGSASQGLRALESLGAIEREPNGRCSAYSARLELKVLIAGFVRQRLLPRLSSSQSLLAELQPLLAGGEGEVIGDDPLEEVRAVPDQRAVGGADRERPAAVAVQAIEVAVERLFAHSEANLWRFTDRREALNRLIEDQRLDETEICYLIERELDGIVSLEEAGLEESRANNSDFASDIKAYLPVWQEIIADTIEGQLG
jgi:hypothetical protein